MQILEKAKKHTVFHEFSGKRHFYKVVSGTSKNEYNVMLDFSCDCAFMGKSGIANNGMCSHVLAVFEEIVKNGISEKSTTVEPFDLTALKKNACLQLIRPANVKINEIRYSESEGKSHIDKKKEICDLLLAAKKDFICEAIFNCGGRADILVLEEFQAIEIMHSEKMESIVEKMNSYPKGISIKLVRC